MKNQKVDGKSPEQGDFFRYWVLVDIVTTLYLVKGYQALKMGEISLEVPADASVRNAKSIEYIVKKVGLSVVALVDQQYISIEVGDTILNMLSEDVNQIGDTMNLSLLQVMNSPTSTDTIKRYAKVLRVAI